MKSPLIRRLVGVTAAAVALSQFSGCYYSAMKDNMDSAILENRLQEIEAKIGEIDSRLGMIDEIKQGNKTFRRR
jgi:hypothetical protein